MPVFGVASQFWVALLVLTAALLSCRAVSGPYFAQPTTSLAPASVEALSETQAALAPTPTAPWASPTPAQALLPTGLATDAPVFDSSDFEVRVHPDGGLYAGDRVSFEVISSLQPPLRDVQVEVALEGQDPFARAELKDFGIARRPQATMLWAWDTRGLPPGAYTLVFTLQPYGRRWSKVLTLQSPDSLPLGSAQIAWAQARNDCCNVVYMTGTAAERDLDDLLLEIDQQAESVERQFGIRSSEPITITLLPRLLGHGGFASEEVTISYLDRNYAGGLPQMVIHHELVHVLDSNLGGEYQPTFLVEGLAVYLTGGHFKPEPLMPRAAALLKAWGQPERPGLGWYLPLEPLVDDFYRAQHEIGYLQAGALVEYMVETWGWEAFARFYGDIPERSRQSQALDAALRSHFGLSLPDLEERFKEALRRQPYHADLLADVRLTVQYYNTVRRYQQALDPSAYFLTAWLLDTRQMRAQGIVADYLRHPDEPLNRVLELILANAGEALAQGQLRQAEAYTAAVNAVLEALEGNWRDPLYASLLANEYAALEQTVRLNPGFTGAGQAGWVEVQRMWIEGDQARVWVTTSGAPLQELHLSRDPQGVWQFQEAGFK